MLNDLQIERYSRQLILPEVGPGGQERLLRATVAIVGRRGHHDPALLYLAAAGVGRIVLVQVAESGQHPVPGDWRPAPSNPDSIIDLHVVTEQRMPDLLVGSVAAIAAGDPSLLGRLNRACLARGIPLIVGAFQGTTGLVATLAGHRSDAPCYACAGDSLASFPDTDTFSAGITASLIATLQATAAIKLIINNGAGGVSFDELLACDTTRRSFSLRTVAKDPRCSACSGTEAGA